ncbi:MAG: hypothetical protein IJX91_04145 [Clostridia bacterium]|nr:hypothetical protein [Clostridia bacterium]
MKNKFNDNRLAEEFDLIVLTDDAHADAGFPVGSLGTLTYSYTGKDRPLYAEFTSGEATRELAVGIDGFRVLNIKQPRDLSIVTAYLKKQRRGFAL